MGPDLIELIEVTVDCSMKLTVAQYQQMIQTFATNRANKPFAEGIGPGCMHGRYQHFNAHTVSDSCKTDAIFANVISN